jgi:16S rRNA (guanine527-N7)-methyltransferase
MLDVLAKDELAPTSVTDARLAVDVHIADSLVVLELDLDVAISQVVDIGSGAGFPGLPLAVARPSWTVTLLESQSRKCLFIERLLAETDIDNASAVCSRAEDWTEGMASQDLALVRAVADQSVVLEYAAPLLRVGGTLIDWRGRPEGSDERNSQAAAEALGLELIAVNRMSPFDSAMHHHLHLYTKVRDTPDAFPRRPGVARKRPLGVGR